MPHIAYSLSCFQTSYCKHQINDVNHANYSVYDHRNPDIFRFDFNFDSTHLIHYPIICFDNFWLTSLCPRKSGIFLLWLWFWSRTLKSVIPLLFWTTFDLQVLLPHKPGKIRIFSAAYICSSKPAPTLLHSILQPCPLPYTLSFCPQFWPWISLSSVGTNPSALKARH